jgi:type II secretory pathway component GspD/PulD (secretin)
MKKQRGLKCFLLLIFISIVSLIPGNNFTPCAQQDSGGLFKKTLPLVDRKETEVLLRFGRHEGFVRIVLEAEESFINETKVTTFPSHLKIDFPDQFNLKAQKNVPFKILRTDKLLEVNLNKEGEIKFFRLYFPSRLVFDIQKSTQQPFLIPSNNPGINIQGSHNPGDPPDLVQKVVMQPEEEGEEGEGEEGEEEVEVPAPPAPTAPAAPAPPAPSAPTMPPPAPSEVKPPEVKGEAPPKPAPPKPEKKPTADVSFFFDDADIYEVIQTVFGEVLKVNYIVDPKVKGRVNFRTTTPIPRDQVLPVMEIILRLNGVAVVEEGGLYRIISITDIPKEPAPIRFGRDPEAVELKGVAIVQVVQLQYVTSSEIIKILTPLLSQGGSIIEVPPNYLIIADTDANVKRLLQVVEIFDSEKLRLAKPQVFVYPVQNSKAKDVVNMLQQIFLGAKPSAPAAKPPTTPLKTPAPTTMPAQPPTTVGEGGGTVVSEVTRIFADEITNSVIILATPEDFATIAETIKKIDIVPRQVVIEGLIAQVTLSDDLSLGVAWSLRSNIRMISWPFEGIVKERRGVKVNERGATLLGQMGQNADTLSTAGLGPGFTFVGTDPTGIVRAFIQTLVTESKAKLLAAPHILVSDNREASIQVGSEVPLATQTAVTPITGAEVTSTITSSVQYKDIGIILKVKPQVNESGLVSLELSQEISSLGENTIIAGQQYASITKTEAKTNLVAQDGQTIIIGGLIREDRTRSRSGIPLLSKIPVLGYLFGSSIFSTTRTELIILLTPHVMKTVEEAKGLTSEYIERFTKTTKEIKKEELLIKEKK